MSIVKVCGMRDEQNILAVANLQPDWMGFIFYEKSPRFVGREFVMPSLPPTIQKVGVFVNESVATILQLASHHRLSAVQLHGSESVSDCIELKKARLTIIKSLSIDDDFDFNSTNSYASAADYFLFDSKGRNYGGNGYAFPWSILRHYKGTTPFLLSGGLSISNISEARRIHHAALVGFDVNSGVELSPGIKDVIRVREFINQVKS